MLEVSGPLKKSPSICTKDIWAEHQGEEDSVLEQEPPSGKDGSFPRPGNCENIKECFREG